MSWFTAITIQERDTMKRFIFLLAICLLAMPAASFGETATARAQQAVLKGEKNYLTGYPAHNADGTVNVIIEIPAGTTAKYEVDHATGLMVLEQKNGQPRYVQYLPYPGNYGFVPRTVLARELGGDGDPLDVIVLGDAVPRGSILKARPLGVLTLNDSGEEDSKIVMAAVGSPFEKVRGVKHLDEQFPGVTDILQTWFTSYKGRDGNGKPYLSSNGMLDRTEAIRIIGDAALQFERSVIIEADKPALDPDGNPRVYFSPQARNISD